MYEKYIKDNIVIDILPSAVLLLADEKIKYANKKFYEIFDCEPKDIENKSVYDSLDKENANRLKSFINEIKEGVKNDFIEIFITRKNGIKYIEFDARKIDKLNIVCTLKDVTYSSDVELENITNKSALKNITNKLKLTHDLLLDQEKMANIGQLATGIVHEIFNPLGFVISNLDTLKTYFEEMLTMYKELNRLDSIDKEMLEEKFKSHDLEFILSDVSDLFSDVNEGIQRINNIIDNLKRFSRKQEDELLEYDINEGIKSTLVIAKNEYKYFANVKN